jgi:hypothetical protein
MVGLGREKKRYNREKKQEVVLNFMCNANKHKATVRLFPLCYLRVLLRNEIKEKLKFKTEQHMRDRALEARAAST